MYHFWSEVIEPLLESIVAKAIIEIGSDYGKNTANLLEYCRKFGSRLHVIDPQPKYDPEEWNKRHGKCFIFHRNLSLNVIGEIEAADAVLIDGDHNWYTVLAELKLIEQRGRETGRPFPVVLLHDIHWPYGRRDLYYQPETIPAEHRKPYRKSGLLPGRPELSKSGGLNQNFCNSIYENNIESGVLTAIEDFLSSSEQSIELIELPGIFGLGILVRREQRCTNKQLDDHLKQLMLSRPIERHLERVELERLRSTIEALEGRIKAARQEGQFEKIKQELRTDLETSQKALDKKNQQLAEIESRLENEILSWKQKVRQLDKELWQLLVELVEKEETRVSLAIQLSKSAAKIKKYEERQKRLNVELSADNQAILELESELNRFRASHKTKVEAIAQRDKRIAELRQDYSIKAVETDELSDRLDQLVNQTKILLNSRSWRVGDTLAKMKRLATGNSSPGPAKTVHKILQNHEKWKKRKPSLPPATASFVKDDIFRVDLDHLMDRRKTHNILLVAHSASQNIYGGERSFIDIVKSIDRQKFRSYCLFPATSEVIFNQLREHCDDILVMKYGWWKGNSFSRRNIEQFIKILIDKEIDLVHVNTIMLIEPLLAARALGIPCMVHSREIITKDPDLAERIGLDAKTIVEVTKSTADYIVGNSKATCKLYDKGTDTFLMYNGIDTGQLDMPAPVPRNSFRVGLVSSNLKKKGIEDFAQLAKLAAQELPQALFFMIGQHNKNIEEMKRRQRSGELPLSLRFMEYQHSLEDIYRDLDVVINFSRFAESFGRTVAEAMALRRPVICYDWGALPELVVHGKTGFLVSYGQYPKALEYLRYFSNNREEIANFGERGRRRVIENFSLRLLGERINDVYSTVISREKKNTTFRRLSKELFATPENITRRHYRSELKSPADTRNVTSFEAPSEKNSIYNYQRPIPSLASNLVDRRDKLRIAYFLWHFPVPSETFVLNELRHLVENGHDVKVFCKASPHKDFKPDFPIETIVVKTPEQLAELLKKHRRNIVHSHFVYPTVTEFSWPACELANIPFTFIGHAQDIFRYSNIEKNRIAKVAASPLCLRVFVPGHFHRRFLVEHGVPEGKIIINPQAIEFGYYDGKSGDRQREFGQTRRICNIQRFVEKKGIAYLIQAGKLIEQDGITIDIWGYGPLDDEYRSIIKKEQIKNVRLCGPIKGREALRDTLHRYDLFVSPSVRAADGDMDGIPTILMEAMAAGLPVLSTSVSSIPDLVKDGLNGFLCNPNDKNDLASTIRRFYATKPEKIRYMTENAKKSVRDFFSVDKCVGTLLRTWSQKTVDIAIVSHNNFQELKEIIRRVYKFTPAFFRLIVVDNNSDERVVAYLSALEKQVGNMTFLPLNKNIFVGPGTNMAIENSSSEYLIYLCGKEGFVMNHGWEQAMINYMDSHPDVGIAGHLGYSPAYFNGRGYQTSQPQFADYRNPRFAIENPDRPFEHVQGGLFILRRKMYEEIGGFSEKIPHDATDVEYSYYAESEGWKLGNIPGIISLYHKTRPDLHSKFDENTLAVHPLSLESVENFERVIEGAKTCNICGWLGESFSIGRDGTNRCPVCASSGRERTLYRYLAESNLSYRRLKCLDLYHKECLAHLLRKMFDYQPLPLGIEKITSPGPILVEDGQMDMIIASDIPHSLCKNEFLPGELFRILKPGGTALVGVNSSESGGYDLHDKLEKTGFEVTLVSYSSVAVEFGWQTLFACLKPSCAKAKHLSLAWSR